MYRFFVTKEQLQEDEIAITGSDYNHIRNVLRMKPGEEILLCDGEDREYVSAISRYEDENNGGRVLLKVTDVFGRSRELQSQITLFQGYPKGDKLEQIVKKAVELGVYEVVPVMMNRSVVRLDSKKAAKRVERLNAISLSSAKQAKRGIVPRVSDIMTMEQALLYAKNMDIVIMPYENAEGMEYSRKVIASVKDNKTIGVFIGPEGGFDNSEVELIRAIDGRIISLGRRILRTETAGITILSLLMYMLEA